MPRLPFSLLRQVHRENPLLVLLLQECRSIDSARNELRWLRECALRDSQSPSRQNAWGRGWRTRLKSMCERRSKGFPLQYILGDQPFGDLEILCKRGVFIPRSASAKTFGPGSIADFFLFLFQTRYRILYLSRSQTGSATCRGMQARCNPSGQGETPTRYRSLYRHRVYRTSSPRTFGAAF